MIIQIVVKICKDYIEFDTGLAENTKGVERHKTNFPKEQAEMQTCIPCIK